MQPRPGHRQLPSGAQRPRRSPRRRTARRRCSTDAPSVGGFAEAPAPAVALPRPQRKWRRLAPSAGGDVIWAPAAAGPRPSPRPGPGCRPRGGPPPSRLSQGCPALRFGFEAGSRRVGFWAVQGSGSPPLLRFPKTIAKFLVFPTCRRARGRRRGAMAQICLAICHAGQTHGAASGRTSYDVHVYKRLAGPRRHIDPPRPLAHRCRSCARRAPAAV